MALTTDLVSYWKFDGDATDSVGSNDGAVTGATNSSSYGKINQGYLFDGNDKIVVPDDASLGIGTGSFTLNLWIKFTDNTVVYNPIAGKRVSSNQEGFRVFYYGSTYNYINFVIEQVDNTMNEVNSNTNLDDDTWYMITVVRDAGTDLRIYVNGALDCTPVSDTLTATISNTANFNIGYDDSSSSAYYHNGNIDEVGYWLRALTSTEVSELYNSGDGLQYPFSTATGWTGKINGVTNPAKVNGVAVADISKINGVE